MIAFRLRRIAFLKAIGPDQTGSDQAAHRARSKQLSWGPVVLRVTSTEAGGLKAHIFLRIAFRILRSGGLRADSRFEHSVPLLS
jgi:hypothetical protein